jgi:hypothetical protein
VYESELDRRLLAWGEIAHAGGEHLRSFLLDDARPMALGDRLVVDLTGDLAFAQRADDAAATEGGGKAGDGRPRWEGEDVGQLCDVAGRIAKALADLDDGAEPDDVGVDVHGDKGQVPRSRDEAAVTRDGVGGRWQRDRAEDGKGGGGHGCSSRCE